MARGRGRREADTDVPIDPTREDRYTRWLFLETCRDVERRCEYGVQPSAYEALMLSFLLRKLFLDGTPLVDRARRLHPTPLSFDLVPWDPVSSVAPAVGHHGKPLLHLTGECFDPGTPCTDYRHAPVETVTTTQGLMKAAVGAVGTRSVTVRDLVRTAANALGGVHIGPPQTSTDAYLKWAMTAVAWDPRLQEAAPVHCLGAVGRVALSGLEPLVTKVSAAT